MKNATIVIRMNGGLNEVAVDGATFDRSLMSREDRSKLRRLIVQAYRNETQGGVR